MSAELIAGEMLSAAGVVAIVGSRRALSQLPQNVAMPALVYSIIDVIPMPNVAFQNGLQRAQARVQINALASSVGGMKAIHDAVRVAMDFKHQITVAGQTVISCRLESMGMTEKDNESGIWTQPYDYILQFFEN